MKHSVRTLIVLEGGVVEARHAVRLRQWHPRNKIESNADAALFAASTNGLSSGSPTGRLNIEPFPSRALASSSANGSPTCLARVFIALTEAMTAFLHVC